MPHLRLRKIMTWPRRTFLLISLCVIISNRFYGFEYFKFIFKFTSLWDSKVYNLQLRADNSYFCDSVRTPFVCLFVFPSSHCEGDMWINMSPSRRWWRTEKPGVLQSMGSQRVGHNWANEQEESKIKFLTLLLLHHKETTGKIFTKLAGHVKRRADSFSLGDPPQRDKRPPSGAASVR